MNIANPTAALADTEREQIVLNAVFNTVERLEVMSARALLREEIAPMPAEMMAMPEHQRIWSWVQAQISNGELPAFRTAHASSELRGIALPIWEAITLAAPERAINLGLELRELAETAARRQAVQTAQQMVNELLRGAPVAATVSQTALVLGNVQDGNSRSHEAGEYASALEQDEAEATNKLPAISTGIPLLDAQMKGGFRPGEFGIVVAPTGHGKTRWSLGMTAACLKAGIGVTYCSTEQGETDEWTDDESGENRKGHRTVAAIERIAYGVGRTFRRTPDSQRLSQAGRELAISRTPDGQHALLHVFHQDMRIESLEAQGVQAALRGHKVMFIDNLEHVEGRRGRNETGAQYLATIAQDLARIAKKNKLVVILLAQPKPEAAEEERPALLTEIADARAIARPADFVITCWRPATAQKEAYKASLARPKPSEADVVRSGGHVGQPGALISVAKIRNEGFGGMVTAAWDEHVGRWYDPAHPELPLPEGGEAQ